MGSKKMKWYSVLLILMVLLFSLAPTVSASTASVSPIEAVNDANTVNAMEQALTSNDLGLTLTHYNLLNNVQQNTVAQELIKSRTESGYADKEAIQTAIDGHIFPDIQGNWAEPMLWDYIYQGFLTGYPNATMRPNEEITINEFVSLLNKSLQYTGIKPLEAGEIPGYGKDEKITRGQAAMILAQHLNLDRSVSMDAINQYKDANSIEGSKKEWVNATVAAGYFKWDKGPVLQPHKPLTRAEAVALMYLASKQSLNNPSFFPVGVFLQSPPNASGYRHMGINLFVAQWDALTQQDMIDLKESGMSVLTNQSSDFEYKNDPTIFGWMGPDEPDNAQADGKGGYGPPVPPQTLLDAYNNMKAKDPTHPVFQNLGQGVAWPCWYGRGVDTCKTDVYYNYAKAGDILSFDIYPVNSTDQQVHNKLWMVAQGVDNLREYTHDAKPVWTVIETTNYNGVAGHTPTPDEVKSEVWMALIHGASGITYFAHIFAPTFDESGLLDDNVMRPAVTAINMQITSLATVLNSPTVTGDVSVNSSNSDVPIDMMEKKLNGSTYIFSVAMRDGETTGTFNVPSLADQTGAYVQVIGENRTLPIVNGQFKDDYHSYGVHLYRVVTPGK